MKAIDVGTFVSQRRQHLPHLLGDDDYVDFAVSRMHYESLDTQASVSGSLDWRAEIHLSAVRAHPVTPSVVAGFVDFVVLRLGEEPVTEALKPYGERALAFADLFTGAWLAHDLDENDDFTAGMPISAVLLVLDAHLDDVLQPYSRLRPWAVAEVVHTMLPTTAGLVAMQAISASSERPTRRLVSADRIDTDWPLVGCAAVPGRPSLFGRATAYTYLDDARATLNALRTQTLRVRATPPRAT